MKRLLHWFGHRPDMKYSEIPSILREMQEQQYTTNIWWCTAALLGIACLILLWV